VVNEWPTAVSRAKLPFALLRWAWFAGFGIPFAQTPAVLVEGRVVCSGLPRSEEIEAWLGNHAFQSGNKP